MDLDTQEFFFIEVNPRVQVEHTVTEMVTEIDIVRSQILIAQGCRLDHPDIDIRWNRVTLVLSTHSVGALTELDWDLADQIDRFAA